jgi:hypothetical protein
MKTIAAAVLALSAAVSLNTVAVAEPFNERGQDFVASVQSEADTSGSTGTVTASGFNDRGVDYIADAPAGKPARQPMISLRDAVAHGWNG